jgi:hypothetical protein
MLRVFKELEAFPMRGQPYRSFRVLSEGKYIPDWAAFRAVNPRSPAGEPLPTALWSRQSGENVESSHVVYDVYLQILPRVGKVGAGDVPRQMPSLVTWSGLCIIPVQSRGPSTASVALCMVLST